MVTWSRAGLHIDQADPQVLIGAEFLAKLRAGRLHPAVSFDGDLMRIEGTNRTVVYRIGELVPTGTAYYAAWPD